MAFMMPVVKNDYDIYSKSPPKQKVAMVNGNQVLLDGKRMKGPQRHSINVAMLQRTNKLNNSKGQIVIRVHSKSVSESPKKYLIAQRSRTSSNNTSIANSLGSDGSSEITQNLMVLKVSSSADDALQLPNAKRKQMIVAKQVASDSVTAENGKQVKLNIFQTAKNYWTSHIFKHRKKDLAEAPSSNSVS